MKKKTFQLLVILWTCFFFFLQGFLNPLNHVVADGYEIYPPENGDWIITNETNISNKTIILNGNLSLLDGGTLKMNNVTLIFNSTFDGEFQINVSNGGRLNIIDSILSTHNISNGYKFKVFGDMIIKGSEICYMWGDIHSGVGGIELYSSNVTIENSTISNGSVVGIYIYSSSPSILNNLITSNGVLSYEFLNYGYGIKSMWPSNPIIKYNEISSNYHTGIELRYGSNATIESNNISNNIRFGISVEDSSPNVSFNTISSNKYGIFCYENHWDYPFDIFKYSLMISNNTIYNNTSGIYSDNTNNVITDNLIINNSYSGIFLHWSNSKIINNTIIEGRYGIICELHSNLVIKNSTILNSEEETISIWTTSFVTLINTTFNDTNLNIPNGSVLKVQNYLGVKILSKDGIPISNIIIEIKDNDFPIYTFNADNSRKVVWFLVTDRIYHGNSVITQNITSIYLEHDTYAFSENPREVDMSISHTEIFMADDEEEIDNKVIFYALILSFLIIIAIAVLLIRKRKKRRSEL
ncbi:MAG: right-handed parallel beta-helix repeat-containing protein [Thermoplasmata archaeon]|nr:MAG: right-handed parallel beta-helix repeat-containing protein [Thermoplasmata archaeon]